VNAGLFPRPIGSSLVASAIEIMSSFSKSIMMQSFYFRAVATVNHNRR
jgi:hypothetical protein